VESNYQLAIEDAATIAEHDAVVLADACVRGRAPFDFRAVEPARALGFSSHAIEPPALMALARDHFASRAPGYVLAMRGYAFGALAAGLSPGARANLEAAVRFIAPALRDGDLAGALGAAQAPDACRDRGSKET
jgi:hypothetical protein